MLIIMAVATLYPGDSLGAAPLAYNATRPNTWAKIALSGTKRVRKMTTLNSSCIHNCTTVLCDFMIVLNALIDRRRAWPAKNARAGCS